MKYYPRDYRHTRNYHLESFISSFKRYLQIHYLTNVELAKFTGVKVEVVDNLLNGNIKEVSMADYKQILDKIGYSDTFNNSFSIDTFKMDRESVNKLFNE